MKTILSISLFLTILLLSNCKKSNDTIVPINCDGLLTDTLGTNDNARIYMPNAFTPNGDGLNDIIRAIGQNITSFSFTIYDANNNVVFSTTQPLMGWSTTSPANSYTKYYYKIQAVTNAGHNIGTCGDLYRVACRPNNGTVLYFEDQLTATGFTGTTMDILSICP